MFIAAAIVELMKESEWYTTLVQSPEKIRQHFFIKAEMRKKQEEYAASATSLCQATTARHKHVNNNIWGKKIILQVCALFLWM